MLGLFDAFNPILKPLAGTGKLVRIFTTQDPNSAFIAKVSRVSWGRLYLEAYDDENGVLERWGDVVLLARDICRVDTYSTRLARLVLEETLKASPEEAAS